MAQIKLRSGYQNTYQPRKVYITPKSMQAFERQADRTFTPNNQSTQPQPMLDLMNTGFDKIQEIFKSEYLHSTGSCYRWGSTLSENIAMVNTDGEGVPENHETESGKWCWTSSQMLNHPLTIVSLEGLPMELWVMIQGTSVLFMQSTNWWNVTIGEPWVDSITVCVSIFKIRSYREIHKVLRGKIQTSVK